MPPTSTSAEIRSLENLATNVARSAIRVLELDQDPGRGAELGAQRS
jgi:hypothetical protein